MDLSESAPLPSEVIPISSSLSMLSRDGRTTYFLYQSPFDSHPAQDRPARSRRIATFVRQQLASQKQLADAFGLTPVTINRIVQAERRHGESVFDKPRQPRRRTAISVATAQAAGRLLASGLSVRAAARSLEVNPETLRLHVQAGLVPARPAPPDSAPAPPGRAERNRRDARAPLGMAARDVDGRVAASLGGAGFRQPRFEAARSVACGGVLTAVPTLLESGLLDHAGQLPAFRRGFYGRDSILLLAALLALTRRPRAESLRHVRPGEWGALLGLDRCPEVKCYRRKLRALAADTAAVRAWQTALARAWSTADRDAVITLCFDGHVKTYAGGGRLAPRFVPRQKLCLPAATSYWLNALGGSPFLCWHKPTDPGIVQAVRADVLPALRRAGALGPEAPDLDRRALPARPALTLVFDREGWSPALFRDLARQGVACITWRKGGPFPAWPRRDFAACDLRLSTPGGSQPGSALLAARPLRLPVGRSGHCELREIRRLDRQGRQVSLVTTDRWRPTAVVAAAMFSRWSHENFFRYARAEFGLDTLPAYGVEPLDGDETVVNPRRRELDRILNRLRARLGSLRNREGQAREGRQTDKARALRDEARQLDSAIQELVRERKSIPAHLRAADLEPEDRIETLPEAERLLRDTLLMLVYRAETAMLPSLQAGPHPVQDPRAVLKALFTSDACLLPDPEAGTLTVRLHHPTTWGRERRLEQLLAALNASRTRYPGTNLRLAYEFAG